MNRQAYSVLCRVADTLRLMVGVGNYQVYCEHMRQMHPEAEPMNETAYFRYCQQARYPSRAGAIKRCPC
jgi:uncharacterized short protein YbdD (DUF466 family)